MTKLTQAAMNRNTSEVLSLLQQQDLDLNEPDTFGHTALWWAASDEQLEMTRILLQHGARDPEGIEAILGLMTCKPQAVSLALPLVTTGVISREKLSRAINEGLKQSIHLVNIQEILSYLAIGPLLRLKTETFHALLDLAKINGNLDLYKGIASTDLGDKAEALSESLNLQLLFTTQYSWRQSSIEDWLALGASPTALVSNSSLTTLHAVVMQDNMHRHTLDQLLQGRHPDDIPFPKGSQSLLWKVAVSQTGHEKMLKHLLDLNADPSRPSPTGFRSGPHEETPLAYSTLMENDYRALLQEAEDNKITDPSLENLNKFSRFGYPSLSLTEDKLLYLCDNLSENPTVATIHLGDETQLSDKVLEALSNALEKNTYLQRIIFPREAINPEQTLKIAAIETDLKFRRTALSNFCSRQMGFFSPKKDASVEEELTQAPELA